MLREESKLINGTRVKKKKKKTPPHKLTTYNNTIQESMGKGGYFQINHTPTGFNLEGLGQGAKEVIGHERFCKAN